MLLAVERQLAGFLGPLAKVIVKRAAGKTADLDQLYLLASESLDKREERVAFLATKSEVRRNFQGRIVPATPPRQASPERPKAAPAPPKQIVPVQPVTEPDRKPAPAPRPSEPSSAPVPSKGPPPVPPVKTDPRPAASAPVAPVAAAPLKTDAPRTPAPTPSPLPAARRGSNSQPGPGIERKPAASPPSALSPAAPPVAKAPVHREVSKPQETLASYLADDSRQFEEVGRTFIASVEGVIAMLAANPKSEVLTPQSIYFENGKAIIRSLQPGGSPDTTELGANPRYTPPEMFSEKSSGPDAGASASYAYALGIMFYEIMLGRKLFARTFAGQRSDLDWMRWHADPAMKAPPLKSLLPDCPVGLSDLLESMMSKAPEERPANLESVVSRLRSAAGRANRTMVASSTGKASGRRSESPDKSASSGDKGDGNTLTVLVILLLVLLAGGALMWLNPDWYQEVISFFRHLTQ